MGDKPPIQCWGVGGRQSRTDAKYGNIWDHFSVVYEYPDNVRGYHHCRHWVNTANQVKDYILGAKGIGRRLRQRDQAASNRAGATAVGRTTTCTRSSTTRCSPRSAPGKPINNGEHAAISTLLAMMGRTAAYTGNVVTPETDPHLEGGSQPAEV